MLSPGSRIERYEIVRVLGHGGMAVVALARHTELGSLHALKVLHMLNPGIAQRMIQEGRVQASIDHPNVVGVRDVIRANGMPCLVMEYVDGPSLNGLLYTFELTDGRAHTLASQLFEGMAAAHAAGLVHRDLKPHNILLGLTDNGPVLKIADFGLAKVRADMGQSLGNFRTRSGQMLGTPSYMAPEQFNDAKHVDERADIFSMGCLLYEMLTGLPPFGSDALVEIYSRSSSGQYVPLDSVRPATPKSWVRAVAAALQAQPDDRPATVREMQAIWNEDAPDIPMPWTAKDMASLAFIRDEEHAASETGSAAQLAEPVQATLDVAPSEPELPAVTGPSWRTIGTVAVLAGGVVASVAVIAIVALAWQGDWFAAAAPVDPPTAQTQEPAPSPVPADAIDEPEVRAEPTPPRTAPASAGVEAAPAPSPRPEPTATVQPVAPPEPTPTPAPVAAPTAVVTAPSPAPAPVPSSMASVRVRGGVDTYLVDSAGNQHRPGTPIPPGSYQLWATFDAQQPTRVMSLSLSAGDSRTITCSGAQRVCR